MSDNSQTRDTDSTTLDNSQTKPSANPIQTDLESWEPFTDGYEAERKRVVGLLKQESLLWINRLKSGVYSNDVNQRAYGAIEAINNVLRQVSG